ncbi:MAG: hypothetical protein KC502_20895 [Myxococcales bacterium]|nr:hypothetical protein [Myxococcales bacterium]
MKLKRPIQSGSWRQTGLHMVLLMTLATLLSGCPFIIDFPRPVDDPPPLVQPDQQRFGQPDQQGFAGPDGTSATPRNRQRQNQNFPPVSGSLVIGNATAQSRVVRLRYLKPTVQLDCAAIESAPHLALRPVHFSPANSWLVQSGRAVPVQPRGQGKCSAALIDGTGLTPRLLFWDNGTLLKTQIPSTVNGAANGGRLLRIIASEGEAAWGSHSALFGAPTLFDPVAPEGCALPSAETDLSWTQLPSGDHTLVELLTSPDGCSAMDLLTDLGMQRVYLCLPPGMMPFSAGDDVYIAGLATGHNVLPISGVELVGDTGHIRLGRGNDIVYFGKGDAKVGPAKGCPAMHDAQGTYARALSVSLTEAGKSTFELKQGGSHELGSGGKLHLVRASERLVWDTAIAPKLAGTRHVESVWSKP